MGKTRHGARRMGHISSTSACSYVLDPLLVPRLHQYAHNNSISDLDAAVEYLRRNYKEYQRKQLLPFRRLVANAINVVKQQSALEQCAGEVEQEDERPPRRRLTSFRSEDKLLMLEEDRLRRVLGARGSPERASAAGSETSGGEIDAGKGFPDGCELEGEGVAGEAEQNPKRASKEGSTSSRCRELRGGEGTREMDQNPRRAMKEGSSPSRGRGLDGTESMSDSDSESSEVEKEFSGQPSFNLLNSSLRATYHGRPALIIDSISSSRGSLIPKDQDLTAICLSNSNPLEAGKGSSNPRLDSENVKIQSELKPAFAPPSVVAAAARAALGIGKNLTKSRASNDDAKERSLPSRGSAGEVPECSISLAGFSGRSPISDTTTMCPHTALDSQQALLLQTKLQLPCPPDQSKEEASLSNMGQGLVNDSQQKVGALQNHKRPRGNSVRGDDKSGTSKGKKRARWVTQREKDNLRSEASEMISSSAAVPPEKIRFKDIGGIQEAIGEILEVIYPLYHPQLYPWLGLQPMRGLLLHGPPGCGKTRLANAIAFETNLPFLKISAPELVSGMSGESEAKVRSLFQEALRLSPSIIFIDEIDVISTKRESAQREMERRIVTQLMTCMDELNQPVAAQDEDGQTSGKKVQHVLVIGATNRPDALDAALRRPGRFDREIVLGIPDESGRAQILSVLARNLRLEGSFDFGEIAKCTPGYVGADLAALTKEAAAVAIRRILASRDQSLSSSGEHPWWEEPWTEEELKALNITMDDFKKAVTKVQPSTKREGFSSVPDVTWEDVGSLNSIRQELDFFIARRIKHPEDYEALQLNADSGFLLYGPPGCGKTLVAKAVANSAGANFIYIKGPELLNKYVGESERAVRQLFSRARTCAPCVLFFDEIDAMAPRRGSDGNAAAERVVNQLLIEMDGLEQRKGIFILAATNRPDMIDPAILRPGRLGKPLYVPLPDAGGRVSILTTLTRQKPLDPDVDLFSIGENPCCEGFSGADLAALVNEACVAAIRERAFSVDISGCPAQGSLSNSLVVCQHHFEEAFTKVRPSVPVEEVLHYKEMPQRFSCMPEVTKQRSLLKAEGLAPLE